MLPNFRVILSRRAFADLDEILEYIASNSPSNAVKVIDGLWEAVVSLSTLPTRHRIYQKTKKARAETRIMPVGQYLIYYQINHRQNAVRIVTIRHGAQRQPRKFDE